MRRNILQRLAAAIRSLLRRISNRSGSWHDAWQSLPFERCAGELVFAEKTFSITRPIHLVARVDRAYDDGAALTLVELKTRHRKQLFASDIIELSAQRLVVHHATGRRVHDLGYVVLSQPHSRRRNVHKAALLTELDMIELANRRQLLLNQALAPAPPNSFAICRQCEYREECRSTFGTRSVT